MDMINLLADDVICHILSFLPTKEAALTSVLSKRWRYLFALSPTLDFDDDHGAEDFIDFVDRVLDVSCGFPLRKISIKCRMDNTGHVTRWMTQVLKRGVLNLDIDITSTEVILVPLEIFTCSTLVELKLARGFDAMIPDDVSLPSLKTLHLDLVYFYNTRYCVLGKIVSACPVLEELTIRGETWQSQRCCCTVSSKSLKKLTLRRIEHLDFWDLSLDTPSLAYLEYCDLVPKHYPTVNLESLFKAKLDLSLSDGSNPTPLIQGLRNVEVLELLSVETCEMFCYHREAIPIFSNLSRLYITIDNPYCNWEFLPLLLVNSPNLHTLVIKGPLNADNINREYGLSCPVKVLKINQYGGKIGEVRQMKHFLEKLSCLELVKVRGYALTNDERLQITKDLLRLPRASKCNIQIRFLKGEIPKLSGIISR